MSLSRALALILTCAAALAACGGDDGLSAEEYREQGNAACERYEADVRELPQPQSIDDVAPYAGKAQARLAELIDELDELEPPSDLKEQHDQLIRLGRNGVQEIKKLEAAGESGQQSEIEGALQSAGDLDTQSDEVARELGLDACADES